jgi:hypothetical protein
MAMLAAPKIAPRRHAQAQSGVGCHFIPIDAATNTVSSEIFPNHALISQKSAA